MCLLKPILIKFRTCARCKYVDVFVEEETTQRVNKTVQVHIFTIQSYIVKLLHPERRRLWILFSTSCYVCLYVGTKSRTSIMLILIRYVFMYTTARVRSKHHVKAVQIANPSEIYHPRLNLRSSSCSPFDGIYTREQLIKWLKTNQELGKSKSFPLGICKSILQTF